MIQDSNWIKCNGVNNQTTPSQCHLLAGGVEEIRIWDDTGTYRVIYTARIADTVYVLHAFQKKTQSTAKRDMELARKRYTDLLRDGQ